MKKYILIISACLLCSTLFLFANSNNNEIVCSTDCGDEECVSCPCTPDCLPGDEHCTCPLDCQD